MNGVEMSQVQHSNHLGIHRDSSKRLISPRRSTLEDEQHTPFWVRGFIVVMVRNRVCVVNCGQSTWFPVYFMVWRYWN